MQPTVPDASPPAAASLAGLRAAAGLSQRQVAARLGVVQSRVSAIEHADPYRLRVATLAAYLDALGGRLRLEAVREDERITLYDTAVDAAD